MALTRIALPENRRRALRDLLQRGRVRAIEFHDPLSAMLGEAAKVETGHGIQRFDLLWASGFAHATMMGLPDIEAAWLERRLASIVAASAVTSLPMLVDCDTAPDPIAFALLAQRLEAMGVAAVMVEDKNGAKRTSLADNVEHSLEDPDVFAASIGRARNALATGDMMIFARTEALIAGAGIDEALRRAEIYLRSEADGIVIHSKDKSGEEVLEFLERYRELQARTGVTKPLVCIPTAYNHMSDQALFDAGAAIVIHANHMIRGAFQGMRIVAETILANGRSLEADEHCAEVAELIAWVERGEGSIVEATNSERHDIEPLAR